jgi:pimeloyl-ACP methyl ester carboxylesterase
MPELRTDDATIYYETDGEGEPVTVIAHGLTNNRNELAALTPLVPGTKVRFDFRGHGRSSAPEAGYAFADFARDLEAVADHVRATRAVGTSLGAGAIASLLTRRPDRFERMVWLLPAALDLPFAFKDRYEELAATLDGRSPEEAVEAVLSDPKRAAEYLQAPWRFELDRLMWEHDHPDGVARAIRGAIADWPVKDRRDLRKVTAPVMVICVEGDPIHPAELGGILADLLPNAELETFPDVRSMFQAIPALVQRVSAFLAG